MSRFLRPGLPQSTQIPLTLRVMRGNAPARKLGHAKPAAGNPGQGGDNPNLKGALTRYSVDFMIPAHGLLFDPSSDGHRHVSVEAALVVYDREGKALNWLLGKLT